MQLNELLQGKGIDPRKVLVLRHRPTEPDLNKALPLLAADRPDLFNAYQQTQGEKLERAMLDASYIASFVRHEKGRALYVGLYKIGNTKSFSHAQYWKLPENLELQKFGMTGFTGTRRPSCLWFDLKVTDFHSEWKGKLIVDWPPPERSWWRRAHRNVMSVHAILEDSALDTAMKRWDELELTWNQLSTLPKRWQARLSEWRGIYYIFDASDGKGYVGSAYGQENLFGRWRSYASSRHGGNRLLRERNSENFRFTILELVAPTLDPDEVIRRENTWKERLHTRTEYGGLNNN